MKTSEKKYLKALAHSLKPSIIIGYKGVQIKSIDESLSSHELIKIKFNKLKEEKEVLCKDIEKNTNSILISIVGNIAIFYRQNPDESKRKIFFD
jgi:RNA-binding protein